MSILRVNKIADANGTNYNFIKQIGHAKFLGNENSNSSSYVDITNLTVTLTPSSTTSKFLITFHVSASAAANQRFGFKVVKKIGSGSFGDFDLPDFSAGSLGNAVTSQGSRLLAHSIGYGRGSNGPTEATTMTLYDDPQTTLAVTYKLQGMAEGSQTLYINQFETFTDANSVFAPISTLTVMEVDG